ncbi:hypothetical protein EI555_020462 [Monodon monoceros]|uniref:Uncharacterized protein n=1 Tax=Monodon monoceros TaxID=40151 RepID=A0A4U1F2P6_MONMO|nr:hypothetical protein EI555_020462 [Monodon monoceros]
MSGNGLVIWVAGFYTPCTVNTAWYLNLAVADLTIILSLSPCGSALPLALWLMLCKLNSTMFILNFPAISFCIPYLVFKKTVQVEGVTYYFNHYDPWNEIQGRYQLWREIIIPQYQMLISGHFDLGFILPLAITICCSSLQP